MILRKDTRGRGKSDPAQSRWETDALYPVYACWGDLLMPSVCKCCAGIWSYIAVRDDEAGLQPFVYLLISWPRAMPWAGIARAFGADFGAETDADAEAVCEGYSDQAADSIW